MIIRPASIICRREFLGGLTGAAALALVRPALWAAPQGACVGALADWKSIPCLGGLDIAFEFLQKMKVDELPMGQTPIEGEDVFVKVQKSTTKPIEKSGFEVHRKYIDVQYVAKGQEVMGFAPSVEGLVVAKPFDETKDAGTFERPETPTLLEVREGHFATFFPGQAHMPGCDLDGPHEVLKVVVKVSAEWRAKKPKK